MQVVARIAVDGRLYERYITSSEWDTKRKQALNAHGAYCRGCGRNNIGLHVHHRTYARLGRERMSDLVILCEPCHAGVHQLAERMSLENATDKVIASAPAADTRVHVDFVPLNRRPGYKTPETGGKTGQLLGLPIVPLTKPA